MIIMWHRLYALYKCPTIMITCVLKIDFINIVTIVINIFIVIINTVIIISNIITLCVLNKCLEIAQKKEID